MTAAPLIWPGETVVCIGSGPSLTQEDVDYVRGKARVIVVNSTYLKAPWADVLYACDDAWWGRQRRGLETVTGLRFSVTHRPVPLEQGVAAEPHKQRARVSVLRNTGDEGLEASPLGLRTGKNSGYQAINLAAHLAGAGSRVALLAYDMQYGPRNAKHWDGHPADAVTSPFQMFVRLFDSIVEPLRTAGIEVINCSRRTALHCFPKRDLREVLA